MLTIFFNEIDKVLFYAYFDFYDKCKYNLTSNPTINQAKVRHYTTLLENKNWMWKNKSHANINIKPEKKVSPKVQKSM